MKRLLITILVALSLGVTMLPAEEAHAGGMERVSMEP